MALGGGSGPTRTSSAPGVGPLPSPEETIFVQQRLARWGRLGVVVSAVALVIHTGLMLLNRAGFPPEFKWHLGGLSGFLALWLIARRGTLAPPTLRVLDAGALFAIAFCYGMMGFSIPLADLPQLTVAMAIGFLFLARSIFVPSHARRTVVLGVILGMGCSVEAWFLFRDANPADWSATDARWSGWTTDELRAAAVGGVVLWWVVILILATATSRVIYGLRRDLKRLGQYTLGAELGRGGMGVVYEAHHAMLRRPTAVKLLQPKVVGEETLARFEREVQLTARLTHPNTVTIFDYGRTVDGVFYYAMEILDGATLSDVVGVGGPTPPSRAVHIVRQVAAALREAHAIGLVHRDVKPQNVMLCRQGGERDVVKVLDFGLVKDVGGEDPGLTRDDVVVGTPLYMAPEALRDPESVDSRSDVYALGCLAWFLLVGEHAFQAGSVVEVSARQLMETPPPPSSRVPDVPEALDTLVLSCLEKDPGDRPDSAQAVLDRLRDLQVPDWTQWDANEWWEVHGPQLGGPTPSTGDSETTFRIDLDAVRDGPTEAS